MIGLREMSETIDRLRQDAADNHSAILSTVMNTKANEEHLSPFERFGIVNHIWDSYMDPMRILWMFARAWRLSSTASTGFFTLEY